MTLTNQERIAAVKKIVAQAEAEYGVVLVPTIEQMPSGALLTNTMQIRYLAHNNWTPPAPQAAPAQTATVAVDSTAVQPVYANGHEPGKFEE